MVSWELEEKIEEVGDEGCELGKRLKESVKVELDGGVDVNFGDVPAGCASSSSGACLEVVGASFIILTCKLFGTPAFLLTSVDGCVGIKLMIRASGRRTHVRLLPFCFVRRWSLYY